MIGREIMVCGRPRSDDIRGRAGRKIIQRGKPMRRPCLSTLIAAALALTTASEAVSQSTCRPVLAFKEVRFSQWQPPKMERKWTAVLSVDASRCATTSGRFGIVFSRLKEAGLEIEFQEQFMWRPDEVEVSV